MPIIFCSDASSDFIQVFTMEPDLIQKSLHFIRIPFLFRHSFSLRAHKRMSSLEFWAVPLFWYWSNFLQHLRPFSGNWEEFFSFSALLNFFPFFNFFFSPFKVFSVFSHFSQESFLFFSMWQTRRNRKFVLFLFLVKHEYLSMYLVSMYYDILWWRLKICFFVYQ